MSPLNNEIDAYESIRAELERDHRGEWIVMRDRQVVGLFNSFQLAADEAVQRFGRGPYLIRQIGAGPLRLPPSVMSWLTADDIRRTHELADQSAPMMDAGGIYMASNDTAREFVITVDDVDDLRHMLGVSGRTPRGYRNYYVAEPGHAGMARLLAAGLVVRNVGYRLSADECYHATLAGAQLVGLQRLPE